MATLRGIYLTAFLETPSTWNCFTVTPFYVGQHSNNIIINFADLFPETLSHRNSNSKTCSSVHRFEMLSVIFTAWNLLSCALSCCLNAILNFQLVLDFNTVGILAFNLNARFQLFNPFAIHNWCAVKRGCSGSHGRATSHRVHCMSDVADKQSFFFEIIKFVFLDYFF